MMRDSKSQQSAFSLSSRKLNPFIRQNFHPIACYAARVISGQEVNECTRLTFQPKVISSFSAVFNLEVHHNVSRQYVFDKNVLIYCTPCNNVLNKNVLMCLLRHKVLTRECYNILFRQEVFCI